MAVNMTSVFFKLDSTVSLEDRLVNVFCRHYKGAFDAIDAANCSEPAKQLEEEIQEVQSNMTQNEKEFGIILVNRADGPVGYVFYGQLVNKALAEHPGASLNFRATLTIYCRNVFNSPAMNFDLNLNVYPAEKEDNEIIQGMKEKMLESLGLPKTTLLFTTGNLASMGSSSVTDKINDLAFSFAMKEFRLSVNLSKEEITLITLKSKMVNPEFYKKMLTDQEHTDLTIVDCDGKEFKCHKCFLTAQSDVIKRMLAKEGRSMESKTNRIEMNDMSGEAVEALLEFVYCFSIRAAEESSKVALELLEAGHKYNIKPLEEVMKVLFQLWPPRWTHESDCIEAAIRLFIFVKNVKDFDKLKIKSIQVLKEKSGELTKSEFYKQLFKKDVKAAMELCAFAVEHVTN